MVVDRVSGKRNIDNASSDMAGIMEVPKKNNEVNRFWAKSEEYKKTGKKSGVNTINMADSVYFKPDRNKCCAGNEVGKRENRSVIEQLEIDGQKTAENRLNQMIVLSNTTSAEDYSEMQKDGFSLSDADSATIVTETDKIKAVLAKAGVDISKYGGNLSEEQLEQITGSKAVATAIVNKLKENDLPVTKENVSDASEAIKKASSIDCLSDGAMAYLIRNRLEPSIENIYKATNSNQELSENMIVLPESEFEELRPQLEKVIAEAGESVNEEALENAKWLIENRLEVNPENINYLGNLKELGDSIANNNGTIEKYTTKIAEAIIEGKRPVNAMMIDGYSLHDRAKQAMEIVENAIPEDIAKLVEQNRPITLQDLGYAEAARKSVVGRTDIVIEFTSITVITAQRKLEEARLSMSFQANLSLLKKGFSIDTKPIEELVEALKEQENSYYREMMNNSGVEVSSNNIDNFKNTLSIFDELKNIPASILGRNISNSTISEIYEAGITIKQSYEKVAKSYEILMTSPRADMGDSIKKAFQNVDDILKDLEIEITKENQRAVRILAYNEIEITKENIFDIKAKDEEVQRAFKNMTPAVTLEMIKKGISPLNMTVSQLNETAMEIKRETGDETEKFSEYLWKLEKNKEITKEERDSYIGIYRLISQVEKSDGAVIGSLVNQGAELTMKNLLSAVRTYGKGQMDYKVDDEFGGLSSKVEDKRIDAQILSAYNTNCIHDIYEEISPRKVKEVMDNNISINWEELTIEELKEAFEQSGIEDKNDILYIQNQMAEIEEAANTGINVYEFMEKFDIKNSLVNIRAAKRILNDPGQMIEELWSSGKYKMLEGLKEQILERFGEAVKTPQELADAQETLAETAAHAMDDMILEDKDVSTIDIKELKLLNAQLSIASKMAKEENFVIPVQTGDSVTGVSLKIVRGKEKKGLVDIFFNEKNVGKVAASFEAKESGISGVIAVSNEKIQKTVLDNLSTFTKAFDESEQTIESINVVVIQELSFEKFETGSLRKELKVNNTEQEKVQNNKVQTEKLYKIAESFISGIRTWADSDN